MWCAGKLCPEKISRFHLTCLHCRWRRKYLKKYVKPPYWIEYTYLSQQQHYRADTYRTEDGYEYYMSDGSKVGWTVFFSLRIDPRGKFTAFRVAFILVLDKIMCKTKINKPLVELCEFLSNYP